ncbi:MAG: zinc-ribbon domain-containing protein, partial [Thiohalocapsa sp.]
MIVGCPDCGTRYAIDETVFAGSDGKRRLRCADCGHLWEHGLAEHAPAAVASASTGPLAATAAGEPVAVPPPLVVAAPEANPEAKTEAKTESKTEVLTAGAAPPVAAPDPLSRPPVSAA